MQTLSYCALVISVFACLVLTSCPHTDTSVECNAFFSLPASQREKDFRSYDLEKQFDLYRCGMHRRPPDTSLALLIGERGESIVPALLAKLDGEKDELFQYAIIDVFEVMSVRGQLRGRKDVVDRIRQVVSNMKYPTFRQMAESKLEEIEKNTNG